MGANQIILSNRTKKKAEQLKKTFSDLEIVDWGEIPEFNMIINATSLGLDNEDEIKLISTMKKASRLMIIGNSKNGEQTTDHYSMMGFTKAYNTAKKSCS